MEHIQTITKCKDGLCVTDLVLFLDCSSGHPEATLEFQIIENRQLTHSCFQHSITNGSTTEIVFM
jgi:hypothetical protein